jgi:hypothetical protein
MSNKNCFHEARGVAQWQSIFLACSKPWVQTPALEKKNPNIKLLFLMLETKR